MSNSNIIPVTFSAIRRRFERRKHFLWSISKMKPSESQSFGGDAYGLMEGSTIRDTGNLEAV